MKLQLHIGRQDRQPIRATTRLAPIRSRWSLNFVKKFIMFGVSNIVPMILMGCLVLFSTPSLAEEATEEVARLQKIWQGWSDTVHSMEVKGYKFVGECGPDGLSRDAVERLIFETILPKIKQGNTSLDTLNSLTSSVFSNKLEERKSHPFGMWRPFTLVEDSGALRVDELIGGYTLVTVRKDGKEQQYREGARQVSLFTAHTGLRIESIKTFLPDYRLPKAKDKTKDLKWKLTQADGGDPMRHLECRHACGQGITLEYDGTTGFVQRYSRLVKDKYYVYELIQSHPIITPLGIPIPQVVIELRYSGSPKDGDTVVHQISMEVIDQVHVNRSVNPSEFRISVPAGTNIVQFEGGDQHPPAPGTARRRRPAERVNHPVTDAQAYGERSDFGNRKPPQGTDIQEEKK